MQRLFVFVTKLSEQTVGGIFSEPLKDLATVKSGKIQGEERKQG